MRLHELIESILCARGVALSAVAFTGAVSVQLGCGGASSRPTSVTTKLEVADSSHPMESTLLKELEAQRKKHPDATEYQLLYAAYTGELPGESRGGIRVGRVPRSYVGPKTVEVLKTARDRRELCVLLCDFGTITCTVDEASAASSKEVVSCEINTKAFDVVGRRPPGWEGPSLRQQESVGAWWATVCEFEEAAVYAFVQLAEELELLGAPQGLVQRAWEAAADEIAHTHMTRAMALRFGVTPRRAQHVPQPYRGLGALARDNAVEGCLLEAFAALQARWQAQHIEDPESREVLERIGLDETRHGQLSWDIHSWALTCLDASDLGEIESSRSSALATILEDSTHTSPPALALPNAQEREALWRAFAHGVGLNVSCHPEEPSLGGA